MYRTFEFILVLAPPTPITLRDSPVDTAESFRFLGTIISQDLKWGLNISSLTKRAQQRMYFLRQLKKFNLPKTMMVHFYTCIIESILTSSITVWYAAATANDKGRLQRIIRSAEKVIGCNLPSLQDLFASRTLRRAGKFVADTSHPRVTNSLRFFPPAGRCGPSGPKPHTTKPASFRLQLALLTRPGTPT